jgi:hypothetical protein
MSIPKLNADEVQCADCGRVIDAGDAEVFSGDKLCERCFDNLEDDHDGHGQQ